MVPGYLKKKNQIFMRHQVPLISNQVQAKENVNGLMNLIQTNRKSYFDKKNRHKIISLCLELYMTGKLIC